MTEAARASAAGERSSDGDERAETGILVRAYRAIELLFSVHARVARREATADFRRIVSGLFIGLAAFGMAMFALILGHAAAVLLVQRRFQLDMSASIGAVAGADAALALILLLLARARLSTPVLAETRAMVKKAASVLRG